MNPHSVPQNPGKSSGKVKFSGEGVLLLDKPSGPTSHDLVKMVKGRIGASKLGHGGTLDPFATGVLVMLVNGATKLSPFLMNHWKPPGKHRLTFFYHALYLELSLQLLPTQLFLLPSKGLS